MEKTGLIIPRFAVCPECDRKFDLLDTEDADEWYYGHDCETTEDE